MKKAMFHRFTHFLHQAVDAVSDSLTPTLPPQEEFVYHWKSLTAYFIDNKDGAVSIEETALPEHLATMLHIIQEEDLKLRDTGTTGASLEFLLKNRILETLYTLGRTDYPSGMKQIVLSFFTKLLSRIFHPLLPHINVHRAVQQMVKTCGETRAGPTVKEEIEFLCTVCAKIKTDPYLANFFIEGVKQPNINASESRAGLNQRRHHPFSLVKALLALSHSEDARVSIKACEGLMLCASLPEPSVASVLVEQTEFCNYIAHRLCQLYAKLPPMIMPEDLEKVEAKWGTLDQDSSTNLTPGPSTSSAETDVDPGPTNPIPLFTPPRQPGPRLPDCITRADLRRYVIFDIIIERDEQQTFQGKRQVISFLSWLDYCDQMIAVANPEVGKALAKQIQAKLLTDKLLPDLMQLSESGAIVATTYLTRWLRTISSKELLKEFCFFLLGESRHYEEQDKNDHVLNKRLLERCNHVSEEVCVATLKLFDTLLQKEEEHIFHNLVLRNLLGRSYITDENTQAAFSYRESETGSITSEDERKQLEKPKDSDVQVTNTEQYLKMSDDPLKTDECGKIDNIELQSTSFSPLINPSSPSIPSPSSPSSPKCFKSEVHKVINSFLTLLPEEAKSSYDTADSGYDIYLKDAQVQFSIQETICKDWGWPKRPLKETEYISETFYEGSFLNMLLDKLLHMLDQSYSVNLLLTAVISKVALIPHPNLDEFLLEPFLASPPGSRTLYTVLRKVSSEIKQNQKSDSTFSEKLLLARKQLLGLIPTIHRFDDQSRMEAIIVLEEFCKELSAIIFVKHHAAVARV